mgnify:CR=1 FL=1
MTVEAPVIMKVVTVFRHYGALTPNLSGLAGLTQKVRLYGERRLATGCGW